MTSIDVIENKISALRKYEAGIISGELMQKLVQMTGFRNVIAHAYDDLDYDIVFDVLHNGRNDIGAFLEALEY
jgi:uncharacterized protein YutE (UPF0331/DUF86 family)